MSKKTDIQKLLIEKGLHNMIGDALEIVEPEIIAKNLNISLKEADLSSLWDNVSGFIKYENDTFTIVLSVSDHYNRKRFTLAHEIGHYFLHQAILKKEWVYIDTRESMMFRWGVYSQEEQEANMFAAEYLMPEDRVKELYQKYWVTEILAWFFHVSNLAMAFRIDNLFRD